MQDNLKFDHGKLRLDLVPTDGILALAQVLTSGAEKYGERGWEKGMAWSRVYNSAMRHLLAFWGGEDIDAESGLPHVQHALWNCAALAWYKEHCQDKDDRPA